MASSQVPGVHITPRANLQWSVKGLEAGTFQFRGQAVVLVSLPQLGISEGGQAVPGTGQLQKYDFWGTQTYPDCQCQVLDFSEPGQG